ncbi:hypothetical protein ASF91_19610 [Rhizobium sp. Leaf155]|nr:hypothetical protein ASF91_19610 [Rhizobium sp. Leaf155]
MRIQTANDNELKETMADAMLRVGEGCTVKDLREWFTDAEIARVGDAASARAYEKQVEENREAA